MVLSYIQDTETIEILTRLDRIHNRNKLAFDLGGVADSVMDFGRQHIKTDSITDIVESLGDVMIPGILFKINPLLGILDVVATVLGFPVSRIVKTIFEFVSGKLKSGEPIDLNQVNQIGLAAVESEAGSLDSTGCFDPLRCLVRSGDYAGFLYRTAASDSSFDRFKQMFEPSAPASQRSLPSIPLLGGGSGNWVERVFGELFKKRATGKAKWLLGGFVVWIVKTLLLGAGLIAGGELIRNLISKKPPQPSQPTSLKSIPNDSVQPASFESSIPASNSNLTPTGQGTVQHVNDGKVSVWWVPLVGGSVQDMLIAWAASVYREFQGQSEQIKHSPAFIKTVEMFQQNLQPGSDQVAVPTQFKSIKQTVDQFAADVKRTS